MPWSNEWIPNELFLEHNGVRIFHTYVQNEWDANTYHFGTASDTADDYDDTLFDVTELPTWMEPEHPPYINDATDSDDEKSEKQALWRKYFEDEIEEKAIRAAIISAIDAGYLAQYIQAGADRPTTVPELDDVSEPVTPTAYPPNSKDLHRFLTGLEVSAIDGITLLFQQLTNGTALELSLGNYTVNYSDGADYTITAIRRKKDTAGEKLWIVQEEEDGPSDDEQDLSFMSITTLIDLLGALEHLWVERSATDK